MELSVELEKWRVDRPDEWKMDEFIRNATKLEAERDALAAQVEALRDSSMFAWHNWRESLDVCGAMHELLKVTQSTPQQNLAEIRAEAIEQAATYLSESIPDQSHKSVIIEGGYVYISTRYLREYADSIRQEKQ